MNRNCGICYTTTACRLERGRAKYLTQDEPYVVLRENSAHAAGGMWRRERMKLGRLAILVGLVAGLGACTDEQIVYVNRPFNPPVDAVNGFLGYFDVAAKQTSCGNCHASTQAQWVGTAHANAWADLQNSGHAQGFCGGCHTVNDLGNVAADSQGYNLVQDASYHDVQ